MEVVEPQTENRGQAPLPLVRLSLILPFIEALDRRMLDADAVLTASGLARATVLDPDVFVPVVVIHRFLEDAARAAADPYLGVAVGESMDLADWPPFADAVSRSATLMEFLTRLICAVKGEASSARHTLEVGAEFAIYRETRTTKQEIAPAQNDAFTAAYTLRLLREATGPGWYSKDVRLTVCDPRVIPSGYHGVRVIGGDWLGMSVRFPTQWLLQSLDQRALVKASVGPENRLHTPVDFLESLRRTLILHLERTDLNVDFVSRLVGVSRQALQRRLKASGTTLSAELVRLKKERGTEALAQSTKPITEIAASLGFSDPTSFTRAFKLWTGQSPREYRKSHRSRQ
ncbi:MAG: helix-turn-helix domain-containing protein [Gammaproteobacteria bacterium]|nr:helix-turn-helix domain-containing protein [Gammaproteobacteria bacterium]